MRRGYDPVSHHRSEPAAARRFDDEDIARFHLPQIGRRQYFGGAVRALDPVAATAPSPPPAMP